MKYHYHVTLANVTSEQLKEAASLIKAKPISIDLTRNTRAQTDRMLTKYCKSYEDSLHSMEKTVNSLSYAGYEIARIKLEVEVPHLVVDFLTKSKYLEGHIKVPANLESIDIPGMVQSKSSAGSKFYNFRIRNTEEFYNIKAQLEKWFPYIDAKTTKFEVVIADSNEEHDKWWA